MMAERSSGLSYGSRLEVLVGEFSYFLEVCMKLTIQERVVASLIYFIFITGTGYHLNGNWDFLTNSSNHLNTLFVASALMLIMGAYVTEPYFTKPVDVIAKTFSILLVLFGISETSKFLFYDIFLWFNVTLLVGSIFLIFIQQLKKFEKLQKIIYFVTTKVAKPEIIFSMLYLLTLFSFYAKSPTNELLLLFGLWLVLIFKKPIETLSKWIMKLFSLISSSKNNVLPVGQAIGRENPYLYTVKVNYEKNDGQTLSNGDLVAICTEPDSQLIGIVINQKYLLNNKWFSVYILEDENKNTVTLKSRMVIDKHSIFYTPNQAFKINLEELAVEEQELIKKSYLYQNRFKIIGYVAKNSNINKIKFHLILDEDNGEHQNIGEGSILVSNIFSKETLYQIIDGVTNEESLENRDKYGFTTVIAKKIGLYDKTRKELKTVKWLPSIYSPVFLLEDTDDAEHDYQSFIGKLPNSSYEIPIKDYDSLVTHNTAILGILGIGKSRLTFELIKKVIDNTDVKVICIDITNQYAKELGNYFTDGIITKDLSSVILAELRTSSSNTGSRNNPRDWGNERIYKTKLKESITELSESDKRILILNPDWHKVMKAGSAFNIEQAVDLTVTEKTRIISEQVFMFARNQGETDEAKYLLIFEEAHSLIPEWNSTANPGDQSASNGTAKVILQGRKYGLGSFVVTQRTANISKSILNQCNTIFALRVFDDTGKQFLENYIGSDYANVLPTLEERHCIAVGKAMKLKQPIILELNDMEHIILNPANTEDAQ